MRFLLAGSSSISSSDMKRFLIICALLLAWVGALAALYDYANLWLIRRSSSSNAGKIERVFLSAPDGEIAIFGSSRALGNYLPSLISPKAYDYGVNGMGMTETLFLATEYLKRHTPEMLIIDLCPWGFDNPEKVHFVGDYRLAALNSDVRAVLPHPIGWTDWIPGVRFQGKLRNSLVQFMNARKATTKLIDHGAEVLLNSRSDAEWKVMDATISPFGFDHFKANEKSLSAFYSQMGRTKVIWVVSPISPLMRTHFQGEENLRLFLSRQKDRDGVSMLISIGDEDFPRALFVDHRHLNVSGARFFTKRLARILKN